MSPMSSGISSAFKGYESFYLFRESVATKRRNVDVFSMYIKGQYSSHKGMIRISSEALSPWTAAEQRDFSRLEGKRQ